MRRFTFNLESVLAVREHAEQGAKRALAAELAVQADRDSELAAAASAAQSARRGTASHPGERVTAAELAARHAFRERRELEHCSAQALAHAQSIRVERERAEVERTVRERDAISRLKERRRVAHGNAVARLDEQAIGEAALAAHRRRDAAGRAG